MGKAKKYNHRNCFLCGEEIAGQPVTDEHIFADGFLDWLGLKNQATDFGAVRPIKYSQIKVPAHATCNNREGSFFESYILTILEAMDRNRKIMRTIEFERNDSTSLAIRDALLHWLAKIYYGLIYWELGMKNHPVPERKEQLSKLTDDILLSKIQASFMGDQKFNIPSTLFWFDANAHGDEKIQSFDFASNHELKVLFVKFGPNVLVACIGDCNLVSEWFGEKQYANCQNYLRENEKSNPYAYLDVVAEIWAVRSALPVSPNFVVNDASVVDKSRFSSSMRPDIDTDLVKSNAVTLRDFLAHR